MAPFPWCHLDMQWFQSHPVLTSSRSAGELLYQYAVVMIMLLQSSADYCKLNFLNLKTFDQEFRTGERLYLLCKSDTVWERCVFRHRLVSPCPCPLSWPTFIYLTDRNRLLPRSIKISKFVNLFTLSCLLLNQTTSISSSLAHFKFVQPLPLEMAPLHYGEVAMGRWEQGFVTFEPILS